MLSLCIGRAVQVEEIGEGLMDPSMTTESLDYLRMMDRDNANKQHSMYLGQIFSLQKQRENKTGKRMELIQAEDGSLIERYSTILLKPSSSPSPFTLSHLVSISLLPTPLTASIKYRIHADF